MKPFGEIWWHICQQHQGTVPFHIDVVLALSIVPMVTDRCGIDIILGNIWSCGRWLSTNQRNSGILQKSRFPRKAENVWHMYSFLCLCIGDAAVLYLAYGIFLFERIQSKVRTVNNVNVYFSHTTVEVWVCWIIYSPIPHFIMDVIIYPCWGQNEMMSVTIGTPDF